MSIETENGLTVEKIKNTVGYVNGKEIKILLTELEMYRGLLDAEQEDCQRQRKNKNHEWERAEKLEIVITGLNNKLSTIERETAEKCADIAENAITEKHLKIVALAFANEIRAHFNLGETP